MNSFSSLESSCPVRCLDFIWPFYRGLRPGPGVRRFHLSGARCRPTLFAVFLLLGAGDLLADSTNLPGAIVTAPAFPDSGISLIRVTGALALVLGLFLGGAWLFKNWQRLSLPGGRRPKLNILETRSLGARQAVFVVGYDRQRFLVAASTAGINLLSHLPDAEEIEPEPVEKAGAPMSFGQALAQVLKRK